MLNDEIETIEQEINPATIGVPDLACWAETVGPPLCMFDNMVLELLHHREKFPTRRPGAAWAPGMTIEAPHDTQVCSRVFCR